MQIFLRRAGKVIGSFGRDDYLAQCDQGGVRPDDEWTSVGEEQWRSVADEAPFLRSNERNRQTRARMEREISVAANITMWSWRMIARNDACEVQYQEDLDKSEFAFIEEIAISGFGAFPDERVISLFHIRESRVRVLTELATVWVAGNGEGKTTLGLALEMIRDVAMGKRVSAETLRYLQKDSTAKVRVDFRTRHGLQRAELIVSGGRPILHASPVAIDGLKRITFVSDDHMYRNEELALMEVDKVAGVMSRARAFMPNLHWSGDGVNAWPAMQEALAVSGMENRTSFSLLCHLYDAEAQGQILVLENPLGRISRPHGSRLLSLLQESPRRGARQVIILNTDDLSFYRASS
jgi:hypothetical protein